MGTLVKRRGHATGELDVHQLCNPNQILYLFSSLEGYRYFAF